MTADSPCVLCDPGLGPVIVVFPSWRLVLNRNQDLLGKCFLVLRRHEERAVALTAAEWSALQVAVRATTAGLQALLQPDHVNYAFLQNQDRHVHFHVVPRYAGPRRFAGETWVDPAFGDHYPVGAPPRTLPSAAVQALADALRRAIQRAPRDAVVHEWPRTECEP